MIFSPVRAIAIDNNALELVSIANGLSAQGISCSAHLFDIGALVPPAPSGGYEHLRLAFVDINLMDATDLEPKNLASVISTALEQAVSKNAGPYCLIFWTSYSEKVDEISPEVKRQLLQKQIPLPSLITHMDKARLVPLTNGKDADLVNTGLRAHIEKQSELSSQLGESLNGIIESSGSIGVASAWETLLAESASAMFRNLYHEAQRMQSNTSESALSDLLSTIAIEAIGQKNAKEDPLAGLTEGLLELVLDHLRASASADYVDEAVRRVLASRIQQGTPELPNRTVVGLNRLFQTERLRLSSPYRISRGLAIQPDAPLLEAIGLEGGWAGFLWRELLHDPARLSRSDPQRAVLLPRKPEVEKRIRPLLVEVGADCDHAQRKPRSHRFLLAAEVPCDDIESFVRSSAPGRRSPFVSDAIEVLGPWDLDDSSAALVICCKRYWSLQVNDLPLGCKPVMRLRGSVVDHLLHRYSTLATRPGFISLRADFA